MIAYLKLAEKDPGLLKKKLVFNSKIDSTTQQVFKPQKTLEPGKAYPVEELIHLMIAYSDNNSWNLLLDNIDSQLLDSVFRGLGVGFSIGPSLEQMVSIKSYGTFLRVLYNSTYLNEEMSEKALEFMSERNFPFGISSSIPSDIVVASKFGEKGTAGPHGPVLQLHDFGIIYYPKRPYMLSVMARGKNYNELASVIHSISQLIFKEFDAQNENKYH